MSDTARRAASDGPSPAVPPRELTERFGGECRVLFAAVHRRLERTGGLGTNAFELRDPTTAERRAIAALLGTTVTATGPLRVRPAALTVALAASRYATDPATVAVAVCGPVRDRAAERAEADAARTRRLDAVLAHRAAAGDEALAQFVTERAGWLLGFDDTSLAVAFDALAARADAPVPRPVLAARVAGDAHALDDDRPAGSIVTSALWALAGGTGSRPTRSEDRRALWADAGIPLDTISSVVLVAGFAGIGAGPVGVALDAAAGAALETPLTLRQVDRLVADGIGAACSAEAAAVRVVENPAVLEAAVATFGASCPPLVCVSGQASLAARRLVRALSGGGYTVAYHGDFDAGGMTIARNVLAEGAVPWRFGTVDYVDALAAGHGAGPVGPVGDTPWDPELAAVMAARAEAVHEESLLDALLADLAG